jgi:hypothetical protein
MLVKLLRSLFAPALRREADSRKSSPVHVGVASRAPGPVYSQLEQLSRLASFASGQPIRVGGTETPPDPSAPSQPERPVMEVVAHASRLAAEVPLRATEKRVHAYADIFSAAARPGSGLNIFVFHVDLADATEVKYVDIHLKVGDFDYLDILRRFVDRVRRQCKDATVYLVTSPGARYLQLASPDVRLVELPVNPTQPMYERANALSGYAVSEAFARDTVFLDSDALVNRPLEEIFSLGFDVGLTYRNTPELMPVNEGVMFFSARRPQRVREFLQRRLATYDRMAVDPLIMGYYGDIKRWRGGQLSLNAVTYGLIPHSPYRLYETSAGTMIRMLPCDTFNFVSGEGEAASAIEQLEDRYIVHFKGNRKYAFGFAAKAERKQSLAR